MPASVRHEVSLSKSTLRLVISLLPSSSDWQLPRIWCQTHTVELTQAGSQQHVPIQRDHPIKGGRDLILGHYSVVGVRVWLESAWSSGASYHIAAC